MENYQFATDGQRRDARAKLEKLAASLGSSVSINSIALDDHETLSIERCGYVAILTIHKWPIHPGNEILVHWCATTFSDERLPCDFLLGDASTRLNTLTYRKATTYASDFEQALDVIRRGFNQVLGLTGAA